MTQTAEFTVTGEQQIHCEGCEQRVDRALKRLAGVRKVEASHWSQRIEVKYDPEQVGQQRLRERLDLLGYDVESEGSAA